jgi:hypothetical protein
MNRVDLGISSPAGDLAPEVNIHFGALLWVYMVVEVHQRVAIIKPTHHPHTPTK